MKRGTRMAVTLNSWPEEGRWMCGPDRETHCVVIGKPRHMITAAAGTYGRNHGADRSFCTIEVWVDGEAEPRPVSVCRLREAV